MRRYLWPSIRSVSTPLCYNPQNKSVEDSTRTNDVSSRGLSAHTWTASRTCLLQGTLQILTVLFADRSRQRLRYSTVIRTCHSSRYTWSVRFDGPARDTERRPVMILDAQGNVFIAAETRSLSDSAEFTTTPDLDIVTRPPKSLVQLVPIVM